MSKMTLLPASIRAVLFDLDGTLVDTALDIVDSLNRLRLQNGLQPLPTSRIIQSVPFGVAALLKAGLNVSPGHPQYAKQHQAFWALHTQAPLKHTCLYDGILPLVQAFKKNALPWGVASNNRSSNVKRILEHVGVWDACQHTVASDEVKAGKPAPDMLLAACQALNVKPEHTLYVGDTLGDMRAAQAANMPSLAVRYGYHKQSAEPIEAWPAHAVANTPHDVLLLLQASTILPSP
jgi:N-acetyl-D-muramate 6-phosphate phosphatase